MSRLPAKFDVLINESRPIPINIHRHIHARYVGVHHSIKKEQRKRKMSSKLGLTKQHRGDRQ